MKNLRDRRLRRPGFTLIELLTVIAIIAILIGLLLPAINSARTSAIKSQTATELGQLSTALNGAKTDLFNDVTMPLPAQLVLRENCDYNTANPLENTSLYYLKKAFGGTAIVPGTWIDWNGDGVRDPAGTARVLYGYDALVFWLGGIPTGAGASGLTPGVLGFSTNRYPSSNPAVPGGPSTPGGTRRGPYYDGFKASRLVKDILNPTSPGYFLYYTDPWNTGMPYAYFTSYKGNDYQNDCPFPFYGPSPYQTGVSSTGQPIFVNQNGFQIISAGKDGKFGPGGLSWNPTTGYGGAGIGADDLANFSAGYLGAAQQ